jgi:hypothetical protein
MVSRTAKEYFTMRMTMFCTVEYGRKDSSCRKRITKKKLASLPMPQTIDDS